MYGTFTQLLNTRLPAAQLTSYRAAEKNRISFEKKTNPIFLPRTHKLTEPISKRETIYERPLEQLIT